MPPLRHVFVAIVMVLLVVTVSTSESHELQRNHPGQKITYSHLITRHNDLQKTVVEKGAQAVKTKSRDQGASALTRERVAETTDNVLLANPVPFIPDKKIYNSGSVNFYDSFPLKILSLLDEISARNLSGTQELPDHGQLNAARHVSAVTRLAKHDGVDALRIHKPRCFIQSALGLTVSGPACRELEDTSGCPVITTMLDPTLSKVNRSKAYFKIVKRTTRENIPPTKEDEAATGFESELPEVSPEPGRSPAQVSHRLSLSLTVILPEAVMDDVIVWIRTYPSELNYINQLTSGRNPHLAKSSPMEIALSPSLNEKGLANKREAQFHVPYSWEDSTFEILKGRKRSTIYQSVEHDLDEADAETLTIKKNNSGRLGNPPSPVLSETDQSGNSDCWGFLFKRSSGWPGSVLNVDGLPYSAAWYTAHVTVTGNTTLLAYSSFKATAALQEDFSGGLNHYPWADMNEQSQQPDYRVVSSPLQPNSPREHTAPVFRRPFDFRDDDAVTTEGKPLLSPKETNLRGLSVAPMSPNNYPRLKEDESLLNTELKRIYPKKSVVVPEYQLPVNVPTHKLSGSKRENQAIKSPNLGSPKVQGQLRLQRYRFIQPLESTTDFANEPKLTDGASQSSLPIQSSLGWGGLPQASSRDRLRSRRDLSCSNCLQKVTPRSAYNTTTAVLSLFVSYRCSNGCCEGCQARVYILQYRFDVDENKCSSLRHDHASMSVLYQISEAGSVSMHTAYHIELPTGCYIVKLEGGGDQLFHGFMWLKPLQEPPNLSTWNTTFYLDPRPRLKEIEVRWTEPLYPFNFSRYSLQLWYQESKTLRCSGYHDRSDHLLQVQPTPSLPLDEPRGVFGDLAPGWYCARVTPLDARCPSDGCAVRASHSVRLEAYPSPTDQAAVSTPTNDSPGVTVTLLTVGLALTALVLGLAAAAGVRSHLTARQHTRTPDNKRLYRQVRPSATFSINGASKPVLLLAWTPLWDDGGHTARAVHALKRALEAHFSVWDYLDLLSLPLTERELLLQSPAGWLHSTLHKPCIKVVLVSTPGAGRWQRSVRGEEPPPTPEVPTPPLDALLFPNLLQQILQSPFLMADYSKIFVVRFSSQPSVPPPPPPDAETSPVTEDGIEGVVQGLLYILPLHLHTLLLALLGLPNEPSENAAFLPFSSDLINEMVPVSTTSCTPRLY